MHYLVFLFSFGFIVFISACTSISGLPKDAKNIQIHINWDDGMGGNSTRLLLSADSCYYVKNKYNQSGEGPNNESTKKEFTVSDVQLQQLYEVFKEQSFDQIKSFKEDVRDRGGTSIELQVNDKEFYKSNSGRSFIKQEWLPNFEAVKAACYALIKDE